MPACEKAGWALELYSPLFLAQLIIGREHRYHVTGLCAPNFVSHSQSYFFFGPRGQYASFLHAVAFFFSFAWLWAANFVTDSLAYFFFRFFFVDLYASFLCEDTREVVCGHACSSMLFDT